MIPDDSNFLLDEEELREIENNANLRTLTEKEGLLFSTLQQQQQQKALLDEEASADFVPQNPSIGVQTPDDMHYCACCRNRPASVPFQVSQATRPNVVSCPVPLRRRTVSTRNAHFDVNTPSSNSMSTNSMLDRPSPYQDRICFNESSENLDSAFKPIRITNNNNNNNTTSPICIPRGVSQRQFQSQSQISSPISSMTHQGRVEEATRLIVETGNILVQQFGLSQPAMPNQGQSQSLVSSVLNMFRIGRGFSESSTPNQQPPNSVSTAAGDRRRAYATARPRSEIITHNRSNNDID